MRKATSARAHLLHSSQLLFRRQLRHRPNRNFSRCTAPDAADLLAHVKPLGTTKFTSSSPPALAMSVSVCASAGTVLAIAIMHGFSLLVVLLRYM